MAAGNRCSSLDLSRYGTVGADRRNGGGGDRISNPRRARGFVRIIDRRAAEVIDRAVNVEIRFDGPNDARRMFELFAKLFRKRLDEFSELRPSTLATEGEQRG